MHAYYYIVLWIYCIPRQRRCIARPIINLCIINKVHLYYKRRRLYLCSAKDPVLHGSGSRMYRRKGTSFNRVWCVCSTFRPSDFLLFVKNGFVVGVRCQGNSESLKECEYPHCASATRRLALDNRTYSAQLANSTHTRCRPTLSWMGGARWPSG